MNLVVKLSDHRSKNKAQRDWYRRKTRKVILAAVPINIGVRQMLIDDGVIIERKSSNKKQLGQALAEHLEEMARARGYLK